MDACASRVPPRIAARSGVGAAGVILQHQELEFRRLFIESPVLIHVERGSKVVRWSDGEQMIGTGEAIALAGGQSLDVTNRPADDGGYRARWLVFDDALIAAQADAHPELASIRHAHPITAHGEDFRASLERAIQALEDEGIPTAIARHRLRELLLWLGMDGYRLEPSKASGMAVKVRRLIGGDLAREWSASDVASAFAMSEATLRRRLSEEGARLSSILVDARMSFALHLLQSTHQPVVEIALSVGYRTQSQFAVRFRARFGFPPTAIRGHRRRSTQAP